jgi:hypothetical protein
MAIDSSLIIMIISMIYSDCFPRFSIDFTTVMKHCKTSTIGEAFAKGNGD